MFGRRPYRHYGRGRGAGGMGMFLLLQLAMRIAQSPVKPPVTIALIVGQVLLFFSPLRVVDMCILPSAMFSGASASPTPQLVPRLVMSIVSHADELHLAWNMGSLLSKGGMLEASMGSTTFAVTTAGLAALTQAVYVVAAFVLRGGPVWLDVWTTCCVGFSGVLFAYKVLCDARDPAGGWRMIMGMRVPVAWAAWAELVIASMLNPRASFIGHLSGIMAGYIWLWLVDRQGTADSSQAGVAMGLGDDVSRFFQFLGITSEPRAPAHHPDPDRDALRQQELEDEALARALQREADAQR